MRYDEDKEIIKSALETIQTPQYDCSYKVKQKIREVRPRHKFRRVKLLVVVCLISILSVSILGRAIPGINELLGLINPQIALMLQPIHEVSESDGIRMEVLSTINDDEMVTAYIKLQDLIGGRIDETLDIYNYFVEGIRINHCEVISYDKETQTAILKIEGNGGKHINGKRMKITIQSFLSHKKEYDSIKVDMNLKEIKNKSKQDVIYLSRDMCSGGGGSETFWDEFDQEGQTKILNIETKGREIPPVKCVQITNMGFIDGKLHIQTKWREDGIDNHGFFYFEDASGKDMNIECSNLHFGVDEEGNLQFGRNYMEYIYDITPEEVANSVLKGWFVEDGDYIEGNWEVNFKLQSTQKQKEIPCQIQVGDLNIKQIEISPLGITVRGDGMLEKKDKINLSIKLKNGKCIEMASRMTAMEKNEFIIKYGVEVPLEIEAVKAIVLNEEEVVLN